MDQRPHSPAASTGRNLVLLVRSGPVNRDLGGSVHIWEDNAPVLISYFYDGAAPVEVFRTAQRAVFIRVILSTLDRTYYNQGLYVSLISGSTRHQLKEHTHTHTAASERERMKTENF